MEQAVSGIRDAFFRDLKLDYQDRGSRSFLYGYFLADSLRELLEKYFPELLPKDSIQPEEEKRLRAEMSDALKANPDRFRDALLREPPREGRKERRDFWQELMFADAGYQAGLVSDTDCYLWLTEYLNARDSYYKDGRWDVHAWLYRLLLYGLQGTQWALEPGQLWDKGENVRSRVQVERDLQVLSQLIREERAAGTEGVSGRLHGLQVSEKTRDGIRKRDYLPWLTARLEMVAIHMKIRTWLQDSGYPLGDGAKPSRARKRDFTMRLFEAFCNGPKGYAVTRKGQGGGAEHFWKVEGQGFCVLKEPDLLQPLLNALEQRDSTYVYVPLAVHLRSGCVFFLAGKDIYEDLYRDEVPPLRKTYLATEARFCYDYLRLDETDSGESMKAPGGEFRVRPMFHENAGRSYESVLGDFKRYCLEGDSSPTQVIREFNQEGPAGTPADFRWAFDGMEAPRRRGPSRAAQAAFRQSRNRGRL